MLMRFYAVLAITLAFAPTVVSAQLPVIPEQCRGKGAATPPGPFSSWSPQQVECSVPLIDLRCITMMAMVFSNPPKSPAQDDAAAALYYGCLSKAMPSDWPKAAEVRAKATEHAAAARKADPTFPEEMIVWGPKTQMH